MHTFLLNNRDNLIARCAAKVALRPHREATPVQLAQGVPIFIDQLIRTLVAEERGEVAHGLAISGAAGGDASSPSEIGLSASAHGSQLLSLGYTIDQVVHDYGDLCQAITDLAVERDAPFSIDSFRTMNRCLDNAIADAVKEFATQHDALVAAQTSAAENQRLGFFAHELRNHLNVAVLAYKALESGQLAVGGATGNVLGRSLYRLNELIVQTLAEVRQTALPEATPLDFSLAAFVSDAAAIADLYASDTGCILTVAAVDPQLAISGNRELLAAALNNLLQNAFKFTKPHSEVMLRAYQVNSRVLIEIQDHCGGLQPGAAANLFKPFSQTTDDKRGLGLGLSIATKSVKAAGGLLSVRDVPCSGCVFTIDLPARTLEDTHVKLAKSEAVG